MYYFDVTNSDELYLIYELDYSLTGYLFTFFICLYSDSFYLSITHI